MVGLWGIAFFSPELISTALKNKSLHSKDILHPQELVASLKVTTNPAVAHVRARLSPQVITTVDSITGKSNIPDSTVDLLAQDLDRIIHAGSLYDPIAFQSVPLKKGTRSLLEANLGSAERVNMVFLNRQLLEHLFPGIFKEIQKTIDRMRSTGTLLQDAGALFGMITFTFIAAYFNRRTAFLVAFVLCLASVSYVFYGLRSQSDVYWMLPLMGFATLSVFAGYSIYFPELFPTRLRGTGVGFCYNTVRYLAAPFPFLLGWMSTFMPFRTVAVLMSGIYLVGIVALIWAPETKGKPLPED
jgi:hypothetical protein